MVAHHFEIQVINKERQSLCPKIGGWQTTRASTMPWYVRLLCDSKHSMGLVDWKHSDNLSWIEWYRTNLSGLKIGFTVTAMRPSDRDWYPYGHHGLLFGALYSYGIGKAWHPWFLGSLQEKLNARGWTKELLPENAQTQLELFVDAKAEECWPPWGSSWVYQKPIILKKNSHRESGLKKLMELLWSRKNDKNVASEAF